uniref:ADP-ribosylation factor-like protein 6 n=1 Tax=Euplotes harpa TaxID=151035 RepID=A0A7S3JF89_9SPIT|mmetsp:Transcript_36564/g.42087  ORF Transcript_36564/g.42087 Transcript_36564/m.42087 type:complete len:118 (+) Transcript_36564:195-548(+)|eukprot:CAMPEP_0168331254 /NCGR_PEP_ID=MMETSP0213-20121227/8221_1 /TAXON_ID=151035 /ORGANISM="Euplotes harpa, Strain FSP1.4" /LENGTH=117 /DNA_ID=CAMNT_0008334989 /DNA_START=189 /DNA_END=542 /DNA_ORIENTATION=-
MSGQGVYRSLWPEYYQEAQGVIFVIDSADKLRVAVAKNELEIMMEDPGIRDRPVPILFFANKKDLPYALSEAEIAKEFELDNISDRDWHIEASNALTGEGVSEGIQWLSKKLPKAKK